MIESNEYIWSTSEKARMRAEALNSISMIVASYGGTVDVNLAFGKLNMKFPDSVSKEQELACAAKVEKVMIESGFCV